jgi:hypothetical protein
MRCTRTPFSPPSHNAQVKNDPYFSHADRPRVIAEHEAKVAEGDVLHVRIAADMRDMAKANSRKGVRVQRFFDTRTIAGKSAVDSAVLALLDYNTVESVMLGSAVLVCLSGLMFSSPRFSGPLRGYYMVRLAPQCTCVFMSRILLFCASLACSLSTTVSLTSSSSSSRSHSYITASTSLLMLCS